MALVHIRPISRDDLPLPAVAAFAAVYAALALPVALEATMPPGALLASLMLAAAMIALSVIDFKTMRLPDMLTLPLILTGIVLAGTLGWDTFEWRVVSAAMGFGLMFLVARVYEGLRGRSGLGLGDAKLLAASGAWTGATSLASVLLCACALALLALGLARLRNVRVSMATAIPFGPFLAAATWIVWLYGPLT